MSRYKGQEVRVVGLGDDTKVGCDSLAALLWGPQSHSRRPVSRRTSGDTHIADWKLSKTSVWGIQNPPRNLSEKVTSHHITGYELIILLIFKGHFFLSCRSLTFATGKRGRSGYPRAHTYQSLHAAYSFSHVPVRNWKKHRSEKLKIFGSFLWRCGDLGSAFCNYLPSYRVNCFNPWSPEMQHLHGHT